jgi:TPR repeat protein
MKKLKVLFFTADPLFGRPNGKELQLPEELRQIRRAVRQARHGRRIEFEPHGAARADDLIDLLASHDAEVVHFSGHGGKEGLVLAAPDGNETHPVDAAALGRLFRTHRGTVRLVVLSACSSRPQAQAIADVVGCAIGTSSGISDPAAITFNSRFYQAIGKGHSVARAFDEASMALQVHRIPESEYPHLLRSKGVDPANLVLVKVRRLVPARVAVASAAVVITAALYLVPPRPVPHELTASDIACGSDPRSADGSRPLATAPRSAGSTSPGNPSGAAASLAAAKAFYRARNYEAAAPAFEQAAEGGNAEAMACLGNMYLYGRGMDPQPSTGFEWVHRAAMVERDPHGMYALAIAYLNGVGTDQRDYLAIHWFRKAAEKGHAEAMRSLGSLAQQTQTDSAYHLALDWYRKAADAGSLDARVDVGLMYEQGWGVPADTASALRLYRGAAQAGSPRGMVAMGRVYQHGIGVRQDYERAMAWYLAAARAGSADAMNSIGVLYSNGLGVRRSRAKAVRWYQRAAQAGSPLARGNLGALGRD